MALPVILPVKLLKRSFGFLKHTIAHTLRIRGSYSQIRGAILKKVCVSQPFRKTAAALS